MQHVPALQATHCPVLSSFHIPTSCTAAPVPFSCLVLLPLIISPSAASHRQSLCQSPFPQQQGPSPISPPASALHPTGSDQQLQGGRGPLRWHRASRDLQVAIWMPSTFLCLSLVLSTFNSLSPSLSPNLSPKIKPKLKPEPKLKPNCKPIYTLA